MPSRTYSIAIKKSLDRKERTRHARWQECLAHAREGALNKHIPLIEQIVKQLRQARTRPVIYYTQWGERKILHFNLGPRPKFFSSLSSSSRVIDPRVTKINPPRNS